MGKKIDLTGRRFGRLIVVKEDKPYYTSGGNKKVRWICLCDCGNTISTSSGQLINGMTKSCGCYQIDRAREANLKSLIGRRYGRLTVVDRVKCHTKKGGTEYRLKCRCDCGNETIVGRSNLVRGNTKSCGCLKLEKSIKSSKKHKDPKERLRNVYRGMNARCYNSNHVEYHNYGGRGITICPEWIGENGFENFSEWAYSTGYDENAERGKCTIERKNVNGNYEPSNCTWATAKEQANNTRKTKRYEYNGEIHTIAEWAEITGIEYRMLKARILNYGYTIKEAIEIPKYTRISKVKNKNSDT